MSLFDSDDEAEVLDTFLRNVGASDNSSLDDILTSATSRAAAVASHATVPVPAAALAHKKRKQPLAAIRQWGDGFLASSPALAAAPVGLARSQPLTWTALDAAAPAAGGGFLASSPALAVAPVGLARPQPLTWTALDAAAPAGVASHATAITGFANPSVPAPAAALPALQPPAALRRWRHSKYTQEPALRQCLRDTLAVAHGQNEASLNLVAEQSGIPARTLRRWLAALAPTDAWHAKAIELDLVPQPGYGATAGALSLRRSINCALQDAPRRHRLRVEQAEAPSHGNSNFYDNDSCTGSVPYTE
jgi:hypothetical protein